jgi:hypothetical protein
LFRTSLKGPFYGNLFNDFPLSFFLSGGRKRGRERVKERERGEKGKREEGGREGEGKRGREGERERERREERERERELLKAFFAPSLNSEHLEHG